MIIKKMNDLLTVVLDLNLEILKSLNPVALLRDLSLFLNAYQLQSSKNSYRVYAAFPSEALLLFPLDED
jgi:hypothetical protein